MSQWMIPYDKLDEKQKHFIDEDVYKKKRIWIQGFAGSGKSVLLIHAICDIRIKEPKSKLCLVVFTHSLKQLFIAGMRELKIQNVIILTYYEFAKRSYNFDYIFCDEVQDLPPRILKEMKLRSRKLILAGDENQSIYTHDPQMGEAVVKHDEIPMITKAEPYELETNYRLTKSILKSVKKLLSSIGEMFSSKIDKTKKDVTPILVKSSNREEEVKYILEKAKESFSIDENSLIILPTHNEILNFLNIALELEGIHPWEVVYNRWNKPDYRQLHIYLKKNNIDIEYIGNGYGNLFEHGNKKIIIMTYHSSKGLDFDNVFLPFLDEHILNDFFTDTLFMVGMTRTKKQLTLSYINNLHPYIRRFKDICIEINAKDIPSTDNSSEIDDFDF